MFTLSTEISAHGLEANSELMFSQLFPIERDVVRQLYEVGVQAYANRLSDGQWTREIKLCLLKLGQAQGFLTYPRLKEIGFEYEWMFDVVWLEAKADVNHPEGFDWHHIRGVRLACESEWGTYQDAILDDFLKLTVVIADLRLFVYTNVPVVVRNGGKEHPVDLCKRVSPMSRGFRYLAVGFPNSGKGEFRVDSWIA